MADDPQEPPFIAFNFSVEISMPGRPNLSSAFSECDGLEITMEVKTLKEGGANGKLVRLAGPVNFGQLTLKRGMTANFDLWDWFRAVVIDPGLRADAEVVMF